MLSILHPYIATDSESLLLSISDSTQKKTSLFLLYSEFCLRAKANPAYLEVLKNSLYLGVDGKGVIWALEQVDEAENSTEPRPINNWFKYATQYLGNLYSAFNTIAIQKKPATTSGIHQILGRELTYSLLEMAQQKLWKTLIVGGGDMDTVCENLKQKYPELPVYNFSYPSDSILMKDGYDYNSLNRDNIYDVFPELILARSEIIDFEPDLILVCLGGTSGKQEFWIDQLKHDSELNFGLAIGIGAALDHLGGGRQQIESPKWLQKIGLEFVWRIINQPYRIKRILDSVFGLVALTTQEMLMPKFGLLSSKQSSGLSSGYQKNRLDEKFRANLYIKNMDLKTDDKKEFENELTSETQSNDDNQINETQSSDIKTINDQDLPQEIELSNDVEKLNNSEIEPEVNPKSRIGTKTSKTFSNHDQIHLNAQHKSESKFNWVYFVIKPLANLFKIFFIGFGSLLIITLIVGGIWLGNRYNSIGSIKEKVLAPPQGSVVYDRNGVEMFKYVDAGTVREVVGLDRIPEQMQIAVIALEDENFYYNEDGIPWKNLAGSLYKCVIAKGGDGCRGGSGLSQQLIKNVTNERDRGFDRKLNELISAYKFGQEVDKKEVLRLYLNWVSFGRNTFGVQEASKSYYGHTIDEKDDKGNFKLTIPKACFLAGMLPQPESFAGAINDKIDGKETDLYKELVARKNTCIDKQAEKELRGTGTGLTISNEVEAKKLKDETIEFKKFQGQEVKFGHIKAFLIEEFKKLDITEKDLFAKGLRIKTTFDLKTQDKFETIIKEGVENNVVPNDGNNGAGVILDGPTGQVIAMVGSVDFNNKAIDGEVNVATSPRQPGSSIKPYVFASAFNNGFNPATILLDNSIDFGSYKPLNFDKKFYGAVTSRWALQNSLNIPAIKALYLSAQPDDEPDGEGALKNFFDFAEKTGIQFPYKEKGQCGIGTAIGGCEVTMMSHATGINTLLQGGTYHPYTPFLEIKEQSEKTEDIYQLALKGEKKPYAKVDNAISAGVANQVAKVMADSDQRVQSIWGSTSQWLKLPDWTGENSVASKTGTTNDVKDMWVVGGSPYYTVAVWAGNTDSTPMYEKASSSGVLGPLWQETMEMLHKNVPKKGFATDGLISTKINPADGLLSENGTAELLTEQQIKRLEEVKLAKKDNKTIPKTASIFTTRTPVLYNKVKVNAADNLLIDEKSDIPAELIKTIECTYTQGEFPAATNWKQSGIGVYSRNSCPYEYSTFKKEDYKVTVTSNIVAGAKAPELFSIKANSPGDTIKIRLIQLKIDGVAVIQSTDTDSLGFSPVNLSGKKKVQIVVKSDNAENIFDFADVEFTPNTNVSSNTISINGTESSTNQKSSNIPNSQVTNQNNINNGSNKNNN
jgi:exopolysaccharide biosynthesis WecB/TagA/CpsF family protein